MHLFPYRLSKVGYKTSYSPHPHPDQAPDHHTPQIMATNALTPIPARISPKPSRTSIVHGHPTSLSSAVPMILYATNSSLPTAIGRERCPAGTACRTGASCGARAVWELGGRTRMAWTGLWSDNVSSDVDEKWVIRVRSSLDDALALGSVNKLSGSVCEAKRIRSVYPGIRFLRHQLFTNLSCGTLTYWLYPCTCPAIHLYVGANFVKSPSLNPPKAFPSACCFLSVSSCTISPRSFSISRSSVTALLSLGYPVEGIFENR